MKPSYLFALVAGDLGAVSGSYTTTSGRDVEINVYSEKENVDQCDFAVASLQKVRRSRLGRARQHATSARRDRDPVVVVARSDDQTADDDSDSFATATWRTHRR
jgi:hypothetical protein